MAIALACRCGRVGAELDPAGGSHLVCHCADCRAAARHVTGQAPARGVAIFQTTPDRLRITRGAEHLAAFRLSPRGLTRWYAACCGTPLANTLGTAAMPFAGIVVDVVPPEARASLGPVAGEVNMHGPDGRTRHRGFARLGLALMRRALLSRLAGRERRAPFFGPDGLPVRPPHVLTPEERARAYAA